jgi:argininosuccinate lyase
MSEAIASKPGMWGGRFEGEADAIFRQLNDSLAVDWRLVQEDIQGSIAWAQALAEATVLTADEARELIAALGEIAEEAASLPGPPLESGAEDVHTWVELRLIEELGDLGKKLHTGRSRNDQVATDLRLWAKTQAAEAMEDIRCVQQALVDLAKRAGDIALPAFTHLQRAQPIFFAHWCLAYIEMLERDLSRLADAQTRMNECPLGSAALAGTTYPIDRGALAAALDFAGPSRNSLDAVSDRDFALELLFAASLSAVHLSRLAEDVILYASNECGFVTLADTTCTGSSIMPQKRNPDAAELIRGKAGPIIGQLLALLTTIKGLPTAYNKDLQEDKQALFAGLDQWRLCLRVLKIMLDGAEVDREACEAAASTGHGNATELADHLVERGVPFRDAHAQVGELVRFATQSGSELQDLSLDQIKSVCPRAGEDVHDCLTLTSCLARRDVIGGTNPERVARALSSAEEKLA